MVGSPQDSLSIVKCSGGHYTEQNWTMSLAPGYSLGAMSRIGDDERESCASFVSGVSS